MMAEAEMEVGDQIQMERNSVCGVWLDLVELVRSQDILIVNNEDDDLTDHFLTGMDAYKKELMSKTGKAELAGISFRWVLGTFREDTHITLIAQVQLQILVQASVNRIKNVIFM